METAKPSGPPRPFMYGLLTIQQLFVYLTRFGYPYLVPFIVQEYGFNDAAVMTTAAVCIRVCLCSGRDFVGTGWPEDAGPANAVSHRPPS